MKKINVVFVDMESNYIELEYNGNFQSFHGFDLKSAVKRMAKMNRLFFYTF